MEGELATRKQTRSEEINEAQEGADGKGDEKRCACDSQHKEEQPRSKCEREVEHDQVEQSAPIDGTP